jgi:hypothetical protein
MSALEPGRYWAPKGASDRGVRRAWAQGLAAREAQRLHAVARLRAWLRVHPDDEHARDLLRVHGVLPTEYAPVDPAERAAWRSRRDGLLQAPASPSPRGEW